MIWIMNAIVIGVLIFFIIMFSVDSNIALETGQNIGLWYTGMIIFAAVIMVDLEDSRFKNFDFH